MSRHVRDINQQFWRSPFASHITIRSTHDSTQSYKDHSHAQLSVGIMSAGATCSVVDGKRVTLNEKDIILIQPDAVHSCNPVNGLSRSYHMIYIDHDWCCDQLSSVYEYRVKDFVCDQVLPHNQKIADDLSSIIPMLVDNPSSENITRIESILLSLLSGYCSPVHANPIQNMSLAYEIKRRLLYDLSSQSPVSVEQIAKDLERPTETIIRHFKRCFGITPKSFLTNNRIEKAKVLLKGGMDIVDVALEVGYSDQSQFHRAFVTYTAATPGQYQQCASISDNK